ncbi:hypothetical protein MKY96_32680 [Paenibacillus sp. FSL R7-0302]|uniref:hypothetical protein n=1 Tax=Paenibacillus sp. FSL R7-0302 TaxID=2921681 RepID=UPI0030F68963
MSELKLIKATELDGVTPKATNGNGVNYDNYAGTVFKPYFPLEIGACAVLVHDGNNSLRTSFVSNIGRSRNGKELSLVTKNTIYFFEVL